MESKGKNWSQLLVFGCSEDAMHPTAKIHSCQTLAVRMKYRRCACPRMDRLLRYTLVLTEGLEAQLVRVSVPVKLSDEALVQEQSVHYNADRERIHSERVLLSAETKRRERAKREREREKRERVYPVTESADAAPTVPLSVEKKGKSGSLRCGCGTKSCVKSAEQLIRRGFGRSALEITHLAVIQLGGIWFS
ncbi:hypothetical protein ROHU_036183 [Labeo rohita]|uniref:Uncharacterized protein n=1 Tax=Labeo rohita TaxID=84645 RepID=A0A498NID3_LABRO|nr:hypothetical protein ROHU_036183 [Labeo rohita]